MSGLKVGDALCKQQPLDAVDGLDSFDGERLALALGPAPILLLRRGSPDHGTDPRLTALVGQQDLHQRFAIDLTSDDVRWRLRQDPPRPLDPLVLQHTMDPEPIQAGHLNSDDRKPLAGAGLRLVAEIRQSLQQSGNITGVHTVLEHLLAGPG